MAKWIPAWRYVPIDYNQELGALETVTQKCVFIVYISTISPFGAFGDSWRPQAEALRCQYNALIRACSIADGIVDMDAVLRDPTDIHRMQEGLHLGDGVHPNWHGGRRMADALLAALF